MTSRCCAPNNEFYKLVWEEGDSTSLIAPINELVFLICKQPEQEYKICYWIEWTIWFIKHCKTSKIVTDIKKRFFISVRDKERTNPIWLIWQIFWTVAHRSKDRTKLMQINGLLSMFCLKFTKSAVRKRRCLLYNAAKIIAYPDGTVHQPITKESSKVYGVVDGIDSIYKKVIETNSSTSSSESIGQL